MITSHGYARVMTLQVQVETRIHWSELMELQVKIREGRQIGYEDLMTLEL